MTIAGEENMNLQDLLFKKKLPILTQWFDEVLSTYPADSQNFIREKGNRFANPVGATIVESLEGLYGELLRGWEEEKVLPFLDPIIRMRAVQQLSPSQAISFIPALKKIVSLELDKEIKRNHLVEELHEFAAEVDRLTLLSFDMYMSCREKVHEIKIQELKNSSEKVWQRIRMLYEKKDKKVDYMTSNIDLLK
ncbi:MAG: RsbRD N-terminal domain-containing protein [Deltaproteobacteria bacterium]|nr:RsbRD N-terminal domain-containing protein [Deltaproteobacteria bacterium]